MEEYIRRIIAQAPGQMISYADFMQAALYHPEKGYYIQNQNKIGRNGDFITTSNVSTVFGETVARWFAEKCARFGLPSIVCEVGGGNGRFAKAFLEGWKLVSSRPLTYIIVETSPYHRSLQEELLSDHEEVVIKTNLDDVESFSGLLFSNELFDALPVHVIKKKESKLYEVMIGNEGDLFKEYEVPLSDERIRLYLSRFGVELAEGQRMEIHLELEGMVKKMARLLKTGLMMTVDYGYTDEEWKLPSRRGGSLRGYYRHTMVEEVLQKPGQIDITSHVPFDAFIKAGTEAGLHLLNKSRQDEFFLASGLLQEIDGMADGDPFSPLAKKIRAIKSLVLPGGMSSFFDVIVQGKGV